jgi:transglutaminase-like putative cysteine protease
MLLQVTHETHYRYQPAVETAQHVAYLQPLNHAAQNLMSHTLTINPQPAQERNLPDVYGNARCFFSLQAPHDELLVTTRSLVSTRSVTPPTSPLTWEQTSERFRYRAGGAYDAAAEFVFASPFVPHHTSFFEYAKPSFAPGTGVLHSVANLMQRIHSDFTYETHSTQVNTPALQAFTQRKGVCQDFVHIMLACLRAMGQPARYVSGYLLTEPLPGTVKLVGSDASHAWVSVYVADLPEGARWCDFDPTNNRWGWHAPGADYVTVATGRDFGDVSPLRGVIHGGARHTLTVGVTVQQVLTDEPGATTLGGSSQSQVQNQNQMQMQNFGQDFRPSFENGFGPIQHQGAIY